jgi:Cu+-exporting ATPase
MKSIVFDNAGTIINRVTAIKNMSDNQITFETNTIGIVNENDNKLILVFQTPTRELIEYGGLIIEYLKENPSSYEIAYSKKNFEKSEVVKALNDEKVSTEDIKESAYALINRYDIEICSGTAMIINMADKKIEYVYTAGGIFFDGTKSTFKKIKEMGYTIYIASGDNRQSLLKIASILGVPESNIFDTCNVMCKEKVVLNLQKDNNKVVMVGNNSNDYLAIKQANIGILSIQQGEKISKNLISTADYVVNDIRDVLKIVKK